MLFFRVKFWLEYITAEPCGTGTVCIEKAMRPDGIVFGKFTLDARPQVSVSVQQGIEHTLPSLV